MKATQTVCKFVKRNAPLLLTIGASAGVITSNVLTGRAVLKADKILNSTPESELKTFETRKKLIPVYIPPATAISATLACIIACHGMNKRIQAGLIAAALLYHKQFDTYREGIPTEQDAENMNYVLQKQIKPEFNPDDISNDGDKIWWRDEYNPNPYLASEKDIIEAFYMLNREISIRGECSLNEFYTWAGVDEPEETTAFGWTVDYMAEEWESYWVDHYIDDENSFVAPNGETYPCRRIHFWCDPIPGFLNYGDFN